jgi:hypothetical protein
MCLALLGEYATDVGRWRSWRREEAKQKGSAKMICVTVEISEGALTRRTQFTTSSIKRVLELAGEGKPGRRVRLVFPIDSEAFFVPEAPAQAA